MPCRLDKFAFTPASEWCAGTTTNHTLFWTPLLSNETYPWQVLLTNNVGETNFTLDCADWPIGFFKVMVGGDGDGDGVPAWRDADDSDPMIGGVAVTIDSPLNGSTINQEPIVHRGIQRRGPRTRRWLLVLACLCLPFVLLAGRLQAGTNEAARSGRFSRGSEDDPSYHSFVIPLDAQLGVPLENVGGNATNLFQPWPEEWQETFYHYDASQPASSSNIQLRIAFQNPVAAFGRQVGGSTLWTGQTYRWGLFAGVNDVTEYPDLWIDVYDRTNAEPVETLWLYVPSSFETNEWGEYAAAGYVTSVSGYGLTTTLHAVLPPAWGNSYDACYILSHRAEAEATNYLFVVNGLGYVDTEGAPDSFWLVVDGDGAEVWSRLYTLEFDPRPPLRPLFLDQPHFVGTPLPPAYAGKSQEELTNLTAAITNQVWLTNEAAFVALSQLLRMQLRGAVDESGILYTSNTLITVNYPWVVAKINSNRCVHIFPWLKDTEVIEGLNLYDYMPFGYNSGFKWVDRYIRGDTNILSLSGEWNVPRVLFPRFIAAQLEGSYPGICLEDIGVRSLNRRSGQLMSDSASDAVRAIFAILAAWLLAAVSASGQLAVRVSPVKVTGSKAVVKLELRNTFAEKAMPTANDGSGR